jgi:hypothetical protein
LAGSVATVLATIPALANTKAAVVHGWPGIGFGPRDPFKRKSAAAVSPNEMKSTLTT